MMRRLDLLQWMMCMAAVTTVALPGGIHAKQPPKPVHEDRPTVGTPLPGSEHLHIFMINGLTVAPNVYGGMNGVGDFVERLGYPRPHVSSQYARWEFEREIKQLSKQDPSARFVLVGYSIGGGVVYSIAKSLEGEGIQIDLLVYVDPHSFINPLREHPRNVKRVVNIYSSGPCLGCAPMKGASNYAVKEAWHLSAPENHKTLETLAQELSVLVSKENSTAESVRPAAGSAGKRP